MVLAGKSNMDLCAAPCPAGRLSPTHTYLEDAQCFDQAAHLVLQGEHHGRLAGLHCVLLLRVLVDGAEGGPPGLHTAQHSHCQLEDHPVLPSIL